MPGTLALARPRLLIPRPEFIVLYNGRAPCPDESRIRLSVYDGERTNIQENPGIFHLFNRNLTSG